MSERPAAAADTRSQCGICAVVQAKPDAPAVVREGTVVAHLDIDMVVLMATGQEGVLVAPGRHVPSLSELDSQSLGAFLAALRRVAVDVQLIFDSTGTTITPSEPPAVLAADGHICLRVIPTARVSRPVVMADLMAQAEQLAQRIA